MRRSGIVVPAIGLAVVLVAAVTVVAYKMSPNGKGANTITPFISALPNSNAIAILEARRQELIDMNAATQVLSTVAQPATVDPSKVVAAMQADSGSGSGGGPSPVGATPTAAKQIALGMLPSFGFNQTTQYSCLVKLWTQESSWRWDALNASSGAYGIPQSLPASKMASAGSDWQTNAATQIKWGLGYISAVYGTPCSAWSHEEAVGSY